MILAIERPPQYGHCSSRSCEGPEGTVTAKRMPHRRQSYCQSSASRAEWSAARRVRHVLLIFLGRLLLLDRFVRLIERVHLAQHRFQWCAAESGFALATHRDEQVNVDVEHAIEVRRFAVGLRQPPAVRGHDGFGVHHRRKDRFASAPAAHYLDHDPPIDGLNCSFRYPRGDLPGLARAFAGRGLVELMFDNGETGAEIVKGFEEAAGALAPGVIAVPVVWLDARWTDGDIRELRDELRRAAARHAADIEGNKE